MTLIRHYCLRFTSLTCSLVFLSACQQQNVLPTSPAPKPVMTPAQAKVATKTVTNTIVINLDLTQKEAPKPKKQPKIIPIPKAALAPTLTSIQKQEPAPALITIAKPSKAIAVAQALIPVQKSIVSKDKIAASLAMPDNSVTETQQRPSVSVTSEKYQDLIIQLDAKPEGVANALPAPTVQDIIEEMGIDQAPLTTLKTAPKAPIQRLINVGANAPKRIALAMPLNGKLAKAGQAVVDGFMAARFESKAGSDAVPYIKVYDTTQLSSLDALYFQASADGMDIVIGPLDKEKVIELSQKDALPIPTLALNYLPIGRNNSTTRN